MIFRIGCGTIEITSDEVVQRKVNHKKKGKTMQDNNKVNNVAKLSFEQALDLAYCTELANPRGLMVARRQLA